MSTPGELADEVNYLKVFFVAGTTGLIALNDPEILTHLERSRGFDRGASVRLGRKDDTYYEGLDFWSAVSTAQSSTFNLAFMGAMLLASISWIGDKLNANTYFDGRLPVGAVRPPELEFFRHLRNAAAHGNRWHFVGGEPRRPAAFQRFTLDSTLHGKDGVLFEYLSTGDVFDLFDHLGGYLRDLQDAANTPEPNPK